jgi:hypothetical protein
MARDVQPIDIGKHLTGIADDVGVYGRVSVEGNSVILSTTSDTTQMPAAMMSSEMSLPRRE